MSEKDLVSRRVTVRPTGGGDVLLEVREWSGTGDEPPSGKGVCLRQYVLLPDEADGLGNGLLQAAQEARKATRH